MNHVVNFASHLEDAALKQAEATATMPFIYPHVALMPDAHFGLGSSVGTVFGTKGAIIPAAVGVDIGCGMIGVCTNYTASDLEGRDLVTLRDYIERVIPLSPGNYNSTTLKETAKVKVAELEELAESDGVDLSHSPTWKRQLGSLGGGNHFLELCLDELDRVWMFLHSGSRGVGNKIAQKHIKIAQAECKNEELPDKDLAYLTEGTEEFESYIKELNWAQRFAFLNREEMMDRFARELGFFVDKQLEEVERINCHHNYTVREEHYGETIWLTRKGAVLADEGTPALIPGSMGTASYVVSGKGNAEALRSAPHGAGRRMSRNQAKKRFSTADLDSRMAGIVYRPGKEWIDEIPDAYKDIDQVMADAADLVTIRHKLRQIVNVKGT
ncbi:transferase [[Brevibacterium] flavum]|uniref:3'-phosphate/5'-hydroxy nucleic acid ligase n=1 Tax=[Brevibacterium] flavum TaxID=92706 RepID=A0A0F6Z8J0_9CORY|nr:MULTISPECIES: RtcB family protein [Corynebacterium]AJE68611.1 transferase [Corynebacterium glutamicum]AKF28802.1 transferase [[Brevibacterium] flavum]ANE09649.1 RNA-splicing ligase RtcB [Corynebacterium glutamicum]AST22027.1 RNA-splicing ligase RtcB [Corynebacterium glutamicum ATCC 14067]KEI21644.1 transferase [Corynebacterium glutamicum ATCC 14067]